MKISHTVDIPFLSTICYFHLFLFNCISYLLQTFQQYSINSSMKRLQYSLHYRIYPILSGILILYQSAQQQSFTVHFSYPGLMISQFKITIKLNHSNQIKNSKSWKLETYASPIPLIRPVTKYMKLVHFTVISFSEYEMNLQFNIFS